MLVLDLHWVFLIMSKCTEGQGLVLGGVQVMSSPKVTGPLCHYLLERHWYWFKSYLKSSSFICEKAVSSDSLGNFRLWERFKCPGQVLNYSLTAVEWGKTWSVSDAGQDTVWKAFVLIHYLKLSTPVYLSMNYFQMKLENG